MKYKLGDLIKQRKEKNSGENLPIFGVSKDGFIPPKQEDADISIYNMFYLKDFVYNPARMELGSIAYNKVHKKAICSSLYEMFYVIREDILLPEYLELIIKTDWFSDYCNFLSNGSAREYCRFNNLSEIVLDLPDLQEQKKLVNYYETMDERIHILNNINKKLEDSLKCIYFEFFEKYRENLEEKKITDIAIIKNGYSYSSDELIDSNIAMATIKNFEKGGGFRTSGYKEIVPLKEIKKELELKLFDIVIAHTDLTPNAEILGNVELIYDMDEYDQIIPSMDLVKVSSKEKNINNKLLYVLLKYSGFKDTALQHKNGTTVMHLEKDALKNYTLLIPNDDEKIKEIQEKVSSIIDLKSLNLIEIRKMELLKFYLISDF